jgi:hypothetical protein
MQFLYSKRLYEQQKICNYIYKYANTNRMKKIIYYMITLSQKFQNISKFQKFQKYSKFS